MDAGLAFDADFRARIPSLGCRLEGADDRPFLRELFVKCSPLAGTLPDGMMLQQWQFQYDALASTYPHAMRRIVTLAGAPIARFAINWTETETYGVDLAVLPEKQGIGVGTALLRSWLAVGDRLGKLARLEVRTDNPAVRLYAGLGFVAEEPRGPFMTMLRAPGSP